MPRVFVVPHHENEALFPKIAMLGNAAQGDFKFHILPPDQGLDSPLRSTKSDFRHLLLHLEKTRSNFGGASDDLIVAFFDGILTAEEAGLSNLFMAGARYDEPTPCTAVISLRFISWGILEQKFDYELQRHALLHLIVCGLLGAYTHVDAHHETYGCLLDFNARLFDFNRKLQRGYHLCSPAEGGCYEKVQKERYGNSIIQLCSTFKYEINQEKLQVVIGDLVMGDKFDRIQNATIINKSTVVNAFNAVQERLDSKTAEALLQVAELIEKSKNPAAASLFDNFNKELVESSQDKTKLKQYWDGLVAVLPSVATLGDAAAKIARLFLG
jgi:hypothetical protein